jgi:adenosylcobinamide kinase/adenosylcobinamide-phosphate guanylyltransferase
VSAVTSCNPTPLPNGAHPKRGAVHLILGGARSGKSRFAEALARESPYPVSYLATAAPADAEMRERIAHHRGRRPSGWATEEVPFHLAAALAAARAAGRTVIIDCLTLWVSNWLLWCESGWLAEGLTPPTAAIASAAERRDAWQREQEAFLTLLAHSAAPDAASCANAPAILLVANEVGLGIVPADPLSRRFRDEVGLLNQEVAARATHVTWVAAGLPMPLKTPHP